MSVWNSSLRSLITSGFHVFHVDIVITERKNGGFCATYSRGNGP